jgi:hypothetical protein
MTSEESYQMALRGFRTAERTGKYHILRYPRAGDAECFFVYDPAHRNSRRVVVSGAELASSGKSALSILAGRI